MTTPSFYCFPDLAPRKGHTAATAQRAAPAFQRAAPGAAAVGSGRPTTGGVDSVRPSALRRATAEEIEQAAYCRGYADGERGGYEKGERAGGEAVRKQLESVLHSLGLLLEELESLRRREARNFEKELVELVLGVARKVVGQEVITQPDAVAHLLREALGRIEHSGPLTIRMNPLDLDRLTSVQPQWLQGLADPGRVRFESDDGVNAGGCLIVSDAGDIDARVEQRFRVVAEALREEARMSPAGLDSRG